MAIISFIAIPLIVSTIVDSTLSSEAMVDLALENSPDSTVIAKASVKEQSFVIVRDESAEEIIRYDFERVLPGRFAWLGSSQLPHDDGSRYTWSITPFNTAKNELPRVLLWGVNRADASTAVLAGNGIVQALQLPKEIYFVVGFPWDIDPCVAPTANLEEFAVTFTDTGGLDVTDQFISGR